MDERDGLENRCGPCGHRGFESHPFRLIAEKPGFAASLTEKPGFFCHILITRHWLFANSISRAPAAVKYSVYAFLAPGIW